MTTSKNWPLFGVPRVVDVHRFDYTSISKSLYKYLYTKGNPKISNSWFGPLRRRSKPRGYLRGGWGRASRLQEETCFGRSLCSGKFFERESGRDRKGIKEREGERERKWEREREREIERERKRERVSEKERKGMRETKNVCVWERETKTVCMCVREREREWERQRMCVWVRERGRERKGMKEKENVWERGFRTNVKCLFMFRIKCDF